MLGVIPIVGLTIYAVASLWMLLATIVAVRQALDHRSTSRAVGVCALGWALSLMVAAIGDELRCRPRGKRDALVVSLSRAM